MTATEPYDGVDDEFAKALFEESKRFLEKAQAAVGVQAELAYRHASLLLGFSSLEAHINGVAEEFLLRGGIDVLDQGLLGEKDVELKRGHWQVSNRLKMYRLEDRLLFLFAHSSPVTNLGEFPWWPDLRTAILARNALVHPRVSFKLTGASADRYINAIVECLNSLYWSVFGKKYPGYNRGTSSTMDF